MLGIVETFGSREAWAANRATYIGGSDAAGIMGACPYTSAIGVYARKLGLLEPVQASEAMLWGQKLEPVIATEVADRLGRPVELWDQSAIIRHPERNWQGCTPDALLDDGEQIVQIKTTSNRDAAEEVPLNYQVQVQHELCVTGASRAYLAILIGGQRLVIHEVEPNERFQQFMVQREQLFWENLLNHQPPPVDASESARRAIGTMFKWTPEAMPMGYEQGISAMELDQQLTQIKDTLSDLETKKRYLENQLLQLMGGAELVELPNGVKLSYKQQTRKSYVVEESTFRVFRRSQPK
jgi:putative phage-type endonuclease